MVFTCKGTRPLPLPGRPGLLDHATLSPLRGFCSSPACCRAFPWSSAASPAWRLHPSFAPGWRNHSPCCSCLACFTPPLPAFTDGLPGGLRPSAHEATPATFPDSFWKSHQQPASQDCPGTAQSGVFVTGARTHVSPPIQTGPSSRRSGTGRRSAPLSSANICAHRAEREFPRPAGPERPISGRCPGSFPPPSRPGPANQPCPLGSESQGLGRGRLCDLGEATRLLLLACCSCYPCGDLPHEVPQLTGWTGQPEPGAPPPPVRPGELEGEEPGPEPLQL